MLVSYNNIYHETITKKDKYFDVVKWVGRLYMKNKRKDFSLKILVISFEKYYLQTIETFNKYSILLFSRRIDIFKIFYKFLKNLFDVNINECLMVLGFDHITVINKNQIPFGIICGLQRLIIPFKINKIIHTLQVRNLARNFLWGIHHFFFAQISEWVQTPWTPSLVTCQLHLGEQ